MPSKLMTHRPFLFLFLHRVIANIAAKGRLPTCRRGVIPNLIKVDDDIIFQLFSWPVVQYRLRNDAKFRVVWLRLRRQERLLQSQHTSFG